MVRSLIGMWSVEQTRSRMWPRFWVGKFMCCVKLKPFSISVKSVNIDVVESIWSLQGGAWMGRWRTTQAEQQEG